MPRRVRVHPVNYLPEREYEERVKVGLNRFYKDVMVQWRPFLGEGRARYAPVVDVAVGPFATQQQFIQEYGQLLDNTRPFIERLIVNHNENVREQEEAVNFDMIRNFNQNARCLLSIEIEESGTRKHCLGNLVNASALGRVGILVARTEKIQRVFLRQRAYLHFLAEVGKNTFRTGNALVLTDDQFNQCLKGPGRSILT